MSESQVTVRLATIADLPQIAQVARITWDETYSKTIAAENRRKFLERAYDPKNLEPSIEDKNQWFYVGEVENNVVGFAHFLRRYHPFVARAEIVRLYVLPTYQNFRIGRQLVAKGLMVLADVGIQECLVSVQSSNHQARKFYERHGFLFRRTHGQFLGTQIITLVEYVLQITSKKAQS